MYVDEKHVNCSKVAQINTLYNPSSIKAAKMLHSNVVIYFVFRGVLWILLNNGHCPEIRIDPWGLDKQTIQGGSAGCIEGPFFQPS